jgi:hypothetical protein
MKLHTTSPQPRGRGKRVKPELPDVRRRAPLPVRRLMGRFGLSIATAILTAEAAGFNLGEGAR